MFLLDTMVLSEMRRQSPNSAVVSWYDAVDSDDLFISAMTIGEIQKGICLLEKKTKKEALSLKNWLSAIISGYANHILPVTWEIAKEWGNISCALGNSNADNLIAATAKIHNLTVVTRNIKHFQLTCVPCVNPWEHT